MRQQELEIQPRTVAIGADVLGVDLANIDAADKELSSLTRKIHC